MIFDTKVNGVPCQCKVLKYTPNIPMQIYGPGTGDAHPPESESFDFTLLDRKGYKAPWLERYLSVNVSNRLLEEFHILQMAKYCAYTN